MTPPAAGTNDNLLAVVGSATLFVTTVLLSQWIQSNRWIRSPPDASSDGEDDQAGLSAEIMQWYALRRSEDRLSFQNLNSRAVKDDLEGDDFCDEAVVEPAADFYPRNKNWTHFEKESFDVDTCTDRTHTHAASQAGSKAGSRTHGGTNGFNGSVKGVFRSIEGDDHDYANKRFSRAESDRFVWTESGGPAPLSKRNMSVTSDMSVDPTVLTSTTSLNRGVSLEGARSTYNARIMPNTLTLIRHGQSIGNLDEKLYATTADNAMPLTELGWEQAKQAGRCLKERILREGSDGGVHFIVSPYVRTVETFHGLVSAWCDPSEFNHITDRDSRMKAWYKRLLELGLTWHEDPRIREQGTYSVVRRMPFSFRMSSHVPLSQTHSTLIMSFVFVMFRLWQFSR
jgi:hypothetical protein